MLNPNVEIKKWFINAIATATSIGVYDGMAPVNAGNEYIILNGRTSNQVQGKTGYTNTNIIIVDIVTKSANFGYKRSETISNLILGAINSDTTITLPTGWNATQLFVDSVTNLDALNPLDNVFRTLITYKLIITQI
jgi:hypothetical protein